MVDVQLLPDEVIVRDFIQHCRDEHIAPYPAGFRVIEENTGLSMHQVRRAVDGLLRIGVLSRMPAYPDHGVILP